MEDFLSNFKVTEIINAIVGNNDTEGLSIGVKVTDYKLNAFGVSIGVSGDTLSGSVKLIPVLKESADSTNGVDGTWTAVDSTDISNSTFALVDDPAEDAVYQVAEYKGDKPWVLVQIDFTGTHTSGTPIQAIAIQGISRKAPPA